MSSDFAAGYQAAQAELVEWATRRTTETGDHGYARCIADALRDIAAAKRAEADQLEALNASLAPGAGGGG